MGKASSKHKVDKPELVLELFKKAGHTHHIKPGHVLIEQGKESESLFLVVSGELVLKRGTKELARRGVGQLLGEMSFLLGSKPGVTVVAEAPVTIVELQQSKVLRVLQHDPQLAAQVFRSLAVTLSERVKERSAALRTEVNEAHQPAHTHVAELTSPLEASPRELAKKFGLAASTALIIHCDCSVFFEQNSQRDQDEHPATLYLFETHLCLDVGAFGLGAEADWYTLGVLMYELTEQNLPFGDDPAFNDSCKMRPPKCVDENGKADADLLDLLKRLLVWQPAKRLGSDASGGRAAIRAHPYWKEPEWELVDARQLPSPMRPWLARRMKPRDDNKTRKQQAAALKTASQMARVDSQKEMMGAKEKGNGSAVLAGWDFTSSDAITQEYVENVASCVSLL